MESLELLHKQLDSLHGLHGIVKTMKALSAASIRQYEQAVSALSRYYCTVERGLYVVLRDLQDQRPPSPDYPQAGRVAAIVFGSDHGLCGRFNEEITAFALEHMSAAAESQKHRLILAIGARVGASLEQAGEQVTGQFLAPASASQITTTVQQILPKLDEWRQRSGVHTVYLFYNRHSGTRGYRQTGDKLLPVNLGDFGHRQKEAWPSRSLPTYSMEREALLGRLLYQYLFVSIFRACAESQASEHASRLEAMQSAQRNLDERLDEVTMNFRRARQNVITAELLDVVAGFETITQSEK
jgi:F-type H+-transporting ATPase subunit gamma